MGWLRRARHGGRGFTLLELMAVVAIVGILATIAVTMWGPQKVRARQAQAQTTMQNLRVAMEKYRSLNGSYYPQGQAIENLPGYGEATAGLKYPYLFQILNSSPTSFLLQGTCQPPDCNLDSDAQPDTWTVDQNGNLVCVENDAYK